MMVHWDIIILFQTTIIINNQFIFVNPGQMNLQGTLGMARDHVARSSLALWADHHYSFSTCLTVDHPALKRDRQRPFLYHL